MPEVANPYLMRKQAELAKLEQSIQSYLARANEEQRDLSADETRTVQGLRTDGDKLLVEIEQLVQIEESQAKANAVRARIFGLGHTDPAGPIPGVPADSQPEGTRSRPAVGGAQTNDRDPGHYRKDGRHSFFADMYRARAMQDDEAGRRLVEHTRAANSTTSSGAGLLPPKWLTEEYAPLARQGRKLANAVRRLDITGDPRPIILPKQTGGASNTPGAYNAGGNTQNPGYQNTTGELGTDSGHAEEVPGNVSAAAKFVTNYDTLAPVTIAGYQDVTRQYLDAATPGVDSLLFGDMLAAYDEQVEYILAQLIMAAGPDALNADPDATSPTSPAHPLRVAVKAAIEVRAMRKLPAQLLLMSVRRYGEFLDTVDTTGRPVIPDASDGPMNVFGIGSVDVDGRFKNLGFLATDGVSTDDEFAAFRPQDVINAESTVMQFRYEEVGGPGLIRLGVWGYHAGIVRYNATSVQTVDVSGESSS